jgi:hypothetical protein
MKPRETFNFQVEDDPSSEDIKGPKILKEWMSRIAVIKEDVSYIRRVIESDILVQSTDLLDILGRKVETIAIQVLHLTFWIRGFRNDSETALSGPSKKYLSRTLVILLRTFIDYWLIEEFWDTKRLLPLEFNI